MQKAAKERYQKQKPNRIFFSALLLTVIWNLGTAQKGLELSLLPLDRSREWLEDEIDFQTIHADSLAVTAELRAVVRELHNRAYLEASVDTLDCRDSTCLALLHVGPQYEWAQLANGNIPPEYLDRSGYRERLFRNRPFSYDALRQVQEKLLSSAEDNGFPFAETWLDSISLYGDQASAHLFMDRKQLILLNSINVEGNLKISRAYLEHYLGLHPGTPYNRSRIIRSRDRLRELPFLRINGDPTVTFQGDRADISLPLDKKSASRFDFIIGILPNSNQSGRMLITGDFEGELINQFGLGERIFAQFEQLRPQTQELNLAFNYPYALGLPLGADLDFSLYKRDTTYIDLIFNLGISYLFEGGNYIKAYWEQRSSNLLSIDEDRLLATQQLPPNLDIKNSLFGLELLFQQLDYRFNPRRGWSAFARGGAGLKRIIPNSKIEALELGYLYDSLELRSYQYRLHVDLAGYLPLFSRSTVKLSAAGGFIFSEQPVYRNEQFRIGGNRLLRGFDEEFFFVTRYAVGTLEYRLLLGQNAYLYLFGDYAWALDKTPERNETFFPYGIGSGITFETKAGLFGVSLAFGGISGRQALDFASPKVHFGYVSRF